MLPRRHRHPLPGILLAWMVCSAGGTLGAQENDTPAGLETQADPAPGAAATEELRRLLLSQPSVRRPEVGEALARLRSTGPESFCRGVQETADLLAAAADAAQAAFLYERHLEECPRPGRALLALSTLIGSEQVACGPALAVADSVASAGDEVDRYATELGGAVVRMVCLGEGAPEDRVESMVDHAASRTFGEAAAQSRGYVRARIIAELNRRAGRRKAEMEHLLGAAAEVCSSVAALEALLAAERSPGEGEASAPDVLDAEEAEQTAPLPTLGAAGFLGELWRRQLLEGLDPDTRACLVELLRALRIQQSREKTRGAAPEPPREIDRLLGLGPG